MRFFTFLAAIMVLFALADPSAAQNRYSVSNAQGAATPTARAAGLRYLTWPGKVMPQSAQAPIGMSTGSITPNGAQRGTEIDVTFNGARLADAQEILFYTPGISVKSLEGTDGAVKTKLAIAADCRLGQHALRVRTRKEIVDVEAVTSDH